MKSVALLWFYMLGINVGFANTSCSEKALNELRDEVVQLFEMAHAKPYSQVPCEETSKSDHAMIEKELKSLVKKVFKGKIPNPVTAALKALVTPSQIGTSSEMCPVPSEEMNTAKYQLNQYKMILDECNQ